MKYLLVLMATLLVPVPGFCDNLVTLCDTTDQSGSGRNLEQAVALGGTISFACAPDTTLRFSRPIVVASPTIIDGAGKIILSGQSRTSLFLVRPSIILTLQDVVIEDAVLSDLAPFGLRFYGSVIRGGGAVTLDHVRIRRSSTPIAVHELIASNSIFEGNTGPVIFSNKVTLSRSQLYSTVGPPLVSQGFPGFSLHATNPQDVFTADNARITDSTFLGNGPILWRGNLEIERSFFTSNHSDGRGASRAGALLVGGNITIAETSFSKNTGVRGGAIGFFEGELSLRRARFEDNEATEEGGALYFEDNPDLASAGPARNAQVAVSYSKFQRNKAPLGGAISLGKTDGTRPAGILNLRTSVLAQNTSVTDGGAVYGGVGNVNLFRAVLTANSAANGGAVAMSVSSDGALNITNSLVVNNTSGTGGAIEAWKLRVTNTTIAANNGIGLAFQRASLTDIRAARGSATFENSIVANNSGPNCARSPIVARNVTLIDGGNNLQFPGASCGETIVSSDPRIDSYFVPHPESVARNAGNQSICDGQFVKNRDVYNEVRPQGLRCTIGAVEGTVERQAKRRLSRAQIDPEQSPGLHALQTYINKWRKSVTSTPSPTHPIHP